MSPATKFRQIMSCPRLHVGAHNVWNGWNNYEQNISFVPLQIRQRLWLTDISPQGCSHCSGGLPRPKCQTAILLVVENFEALLELFRKNHPQTFAPFLWWIITGLGRSLGLTCVSGPSSLLLKKIIKFFNRDYANKIRSQPNYFLSGILLKLLSLSFCFCLWLLLLLFYYHLI